MQNKKGRLRRGTNLHVMYREASEAAEASSDAIQPILFTQVTRLFPTLVIFFSLSISPPPPSLPPDLSMYADVRVFRARLRSRSLDAEERLIVAPFLSAVFTARGNPPLVGEKQDEGGRKGRNRFFSSTCHDR